MKLFRLTLAGFFLLAILLIVGATPQSAVQAQYSTSAGIQAPFLPIPHPILSDVQVRKAIAYCTDKDALIASVYPTLTPAERQGLVMDTFIPTANWAYTAPATTYPYSPVAGQNLLNTAGWTLPGGADYRIKNGKELVLLLTTTNSSFRVTYLTAFKNQMKACGVHVILNPRPVSWWFGTTTGLQVRDFELDAFAWLSQADPGGLTLYACDQIPLPTNNWSGQNYMGWCNQTASDAIVQASDTQLTQEQRKPYYATFINSFAEDVPSLPLFARQGSTPDSTSWEHIDFNLQTFTQETNVTPTEQTVLNYTDFGGNQGTVEVSSGAVTQTVTLGYTPLVSNANPPPTNQRAAIAFRLSASLGGVPQDNFLFSHPITVTVKYSDADLVNNIDENSLVLYYWDGASWQDASTTCPQVDQYRRIDATQNLVEARICHLTEFGLIGIQNSKRVYLPLIIR